MNYLTFEEYISLGGVLDITAFNRNINRACAAINRESHSRIAKMSAIPDNVKILCRELTEYYAVNSNVSEKGVASWSQSAGVVNESVSYISKTADDVQSDICSMIYEYLSCLTDDSGTPLLYKGASV